MASLIIYQKDSLNTAYRRIAPSFSLSFLIEHVTDCYILSVDGKGLKYSSPVDALMKAFRAEGLRGLYKGFLPNWLRIGPHTMVSFFIFEQLRAMVGIRPV